MLRKHSRLMKLSAFLLAIAPAISVGSCWFGFVGEPKLPEKLNNQ